MTLYAWLAYNEKARPYQQSPDDQLEWPGILVTEEPMTDDTMRRFLNAQERQTLELIP
jgi:hypothetical protein